MSRQQVEHLLQKCLEGYDAGLSPEECLSAYPHVRAELEPMFRQALSLRFAYAASPSEEFKRRGREALMFHAGRDVVQALSKEPNPDFVMDARQRFLHTAGAQAQEALRDVPPPRLPFWVNARRRLLDTAANPAPRPAQTYTFAMRSAISAAVVVLALAVATLGFFVVSDPANGPGARNAMAVDYIEEQLDKIERQNAQGITPPSGMLNELSDQTITLSAQLAAGELEGPVAARLPAIIERQQAIAIAAVATSTEPQPELREVVTKLSEAQSVVAAAASETPAPTGTAAAAILAPTTTATPKPSATAAPSTPVATATAGSAGPTAPVKPEDLEPGQILVQVDVTDKTYATTSNPAPWTRVTTSDLTFVIASEWDLHNVKTDSADLAVTEGNRLQIFTGDASVPVIVVTLEGEETGKVSALVNGESIMLRSAKGDVIDFLKLFELLPDRMTPLLQHFLTSIEFTD